MPHVPDRLHRRRWSVDFSNGNNKSSRTAIVVELTRVAINIFRACITTVVIEGSPAFPSFLTFANFVFSMYVCACMYCPNICIYVSVCTHVYIYIHTHTYMHIWRSCTGTSAFTGHPTMWWSVESRVRSLATAALYT